MGVKNEQRRSRVQSNFIHPSLKKKKKQKINVWIENDHANN